MDNVREEIRFSYNFYDEDDGTQHTVTNTMNRTCIQGDEVCEMFVNFMESAGFSVENILKYFKD